MACEESVDPVHQAQFASCFSRNCSVGFLALVFHGFALQYMDVGGPDFEARTSSIFLFNQKLFKIFHDSTLLPTEVIQNYSEFFQEIL
jgi:hypothetical protein